MAQLCVSYVVNPMSRLCEQLVEAVDIPFIKIHSERLNFLFGVGDHWGPLHLMDKVRRGG